MAIRPFLAMTALEIREKPAFPENPAWMACHFSPYTRGLSNLPHGFPPRSMVIVNDFTPIRGHDPVLIASQLAALSCGVVLLDFQRPDCEETALLAKHLAQTLPCPVVVSQPYARDLSCPVLLPPVPPSMPLKAHLAPWQGREIWLELTLEGELLTVTKEGTKVSPLPHGADGGFSEDRLHCHYRIGLTEEQAAFSLWRTPQDLNELLQEADSLGVSGAVGFYRELHRIFPLSPSD